MKRSRNRFAWLGILLVALLLSLGVTGVGYALWTDTVDIHGTVEPGCIGVALSEGQGVPSGNVTGAIAGHTISIEITRTPASISIISARYRSKSRVFKLRVLRGPSLS